MAKVFLDTNYFIDALSRKQDTLSEAVSSPFIHPDTKSAALVIKSFKKTGKYSKAFLKDLQDGLSESTYFTK